MLESEVLEDECDVLALRFVISCNNASNKKAIIKNREEKCLGKWKLLAKINRE
jgi:hypothetical protein